MGLSLQEGGIFEQKDIEAQSTFVVNAAFAQRYLARRTRWVRSQSELSRSPEKVPLIVIVANAHDLGVDAEVQPELYAPGFGLHEVRLVRSAVYPESLVSIVRNAVHDLDPKQQILSCADSRCFACRIR